MRTAARWAALACIAWSALAADVRAQAVDQVLVLGLGLGSFEYAKIDEVRTTVFPSPNKRVGMTQVFAEYYPARLVGLGLRSLTTSESHSVSIGPSATDWDVHVTCNSTLLTVQLVPFVSSDGYSRLGILGGIGRAEYEMETTRWVPSFPIVIIPAKITLQSGSTSGSAGLVQIYVDWGGELFGARFGMGRLSTDLDPMLIGGVPFAADASGTHGFLDLRWAFD